MTCHIRIGCLNNEEVTAKHLARSSGSSWLYSTFTVHDDGAFGPPPPFASRDRARRRGGRWWRRLATRAESGQKYAGRRRREEARRAPPVLRSHNRTIAILLDLKGVLTHNKAIGHETLRAESAPAKEVRGGEDAEAARALISHICIYI